MPDLDAPNLALFRKYRPQDFGELVGQEHIQRTLKNALRLNRVSHAYLFSGPRGTGKTTSARLLAKGLNCLTPKDGEPCNACDACRDITLNRFMDVIEIDAASNRGIDEIRDLTEKARFTPVQGKKKIFIIDEVHMLTNEAFNALLKTLEEPPAHAHFVLATTEFHKVPPTIVSRCQHFEFRRVPEPVIAKLLASVAGKEGIEAEPEALDAIAHAAAGGLRDALVLMEQVIRDGRITRAAVHEMLGLVHADAIQDFLVALTSGDTKRALAIVHELYEQGADLTAFTRDTLAALRQRLVANVANDTEGAVPFLLAALRAFEQVLGEMKLSPIPQLPIEVAIVELLHAPAPSRATVISAPPVGAAPVSAPRPAPVSRAAASPTPSPPDAPREPDPVIEDFASAWPKIIAVVNAPAVRMAARNAAMRLEGDNLFLTLVSRMEAEKLKNVKAQSDIADAVRSVTGKKVGIVIEFVPPPPPPAAADGDSVAAFFGGTVVE